MAIASQLEKCGDVFVPFLPWSEHGKERYQRFQKIIFDWIAKQDVPPTCKQVKEALKISSATAWRHCRAYQVRYGMHTVVMARK